MEGYLKMRETPILETDRLFLRKFRLDDVQDVFEYCREPETARFVTWDAHKTPEDTLRFLQWATDRYKTGEPGDWAIMDKATGHIIGSIGLVNTEQGNRCCEVGYVIGRDHWGKGFTTEALQRLVRFLFEECGFNRVQAMCCEENAGSSRVLEKGGFRYEGLLMQRMRMKERFWNLKLYALLLEEWRMLHEPTRILRDKVLIEEVDEADLPDILALQKLAYASEAAIYGSGIAPMTQTLAEMQASAANLLFLKAVLNGKIVGSIRARTGEGTCFIGRLIVVPELQHQGVGRRLLATMEALHPGCRFELFTGHLSQRNLELYEKAGYKPFKTVRVGERESLIYLEKQHEKQIMG
jgi:ribosomal-protein-alanine N-acetyltransferase